MQHIVDVFATSFTWLWTTGWGHVALIVCVAAVAVAVVLEWRRR